MKQDAFKAFKTLHLAVAGTMLAAVLVLAFIPPGRVGDPSLDRTLQAVSVLLSAGIIWIGFNLFKRNMLAARNSTEPGVVRLSKYRTACFIWWAMIEGPGLFAAVCYFLTGNYAFIALAGFHLLLLLLFRPRKANIVVLLKLSEQEVAVLEGK